MPRTRCKLPRGDSSVGSQPRRKLRLDDNNLSTLPAELRACSELRHISLKLFTLDAAIADRIKDYLPKGRRKKHHGEVTQYERTDLD